MEDSKSLSTEETVNLYYIFSPTSNKYYKGSGRWVDGIKKAKKYNRIGDAKNAITTSLEYRTVASGRKQYSPIPEFIIETYSIFLLTNLVKREIIELQKDKHGYYKTTKAKK